MGSAGRALERIVNVGVTDACDENESAVRRVFTSASLFVMIVAPLWGIVYMAYGEVGPGLIPTSYSVITALSFAALERFGGWHWFRFSQTLFIFVLPFTLQLTLGGFVLGSVVLIWSTLAPIGSLWGGRSREAMFWVGAFLLCTIGSGLVESQLRDSNGLPEWLRTVFFVMNVVAVTGVVFLLLGFFVGQKDTMIEVMQRNRDLESAYLQQEVSLRHSDKLATLGKLSAGLAHELNNPAAAVQQATNELSKLLLGDDEVRADLAGLGLSSDDEAAVWQLASKISDRVDHPEFLDPLERSDREAATQDVLERAGIENGWELAPALVDLGVRPDDLDRLSSAIPHDRLDDSVGLLARQFHRQTLLSSLQESTTRIIAMVRALKSYTFLDQAPRQLIDVHEGLDSTLVIFQNRLKSGIEVHRLYGDLPPIEAHGSELNQVWTNILDNALDAMDDRGTITLSTHHDGDDVIVEIEDDGPGVPEELVETIFDPFVTSKAPGDGTGLGLNIAHSIVTQKHQGQISLTSRPGRTAFIIRLPITAPTDEGSKE